MLIDIATGIEVAHRDMEKRLPKISKEMKTLETSAPNSKHRRRAETLDHEVRETIRSLNKLTDGMSRKWVTNLCETEQEVITTWARIKRLTDSPRK